MATGEGAGEKQAQRRRGEFKQPEVFCGFMGYLAVSGIIRGGPPEVGSGNGIWDA